MKTYFTNLFPIAYYSMDGGNQSFIPIGTIFTISGIEGDFFQLKPLKKIKDLGHILVFSVAMLDRGFNQQEDCE